MTVHGEQALVPSVRKAEAAKALAHFTDVNNQAARTLDSSLNTTIEAGSLGAIDQAGIAARHANSPSGNPNYSPLVLSDSRFLIPRQRGWPKWFIADTASNRGGNGVRWLLVFQRSSASEAWRATYLTVVQPDQMPRFATDKSGYVKPAPVSAPDLLIQPRRLSTSYTSYLQRGKEATLVFADGPSTSGWREERRKEASTSSAVTQFADQPAEGEGFAPIAVRTQDGGALVFFSSHHQSRLTIRKGLTLTVKDADTRALMTGTPKTSVTKLWVSEQGVLVPPASESTGKVVFLGRLMGLVGAKGE